MSTVKVRLHKDGPFEVSELAAIVALASPKEQASLALSIEEHEQQEPIVLWKGLVVDGRCRMKACTALGKHIVYRELDNELTEEDVKVFVKAINTRRNLTHTQKTMTAARLSITKSDTRPRLAEQWATSVALITNAVFIQKSYPELGDALFNGLAVTITNKQGLQIDSVKISAVYAHLKRIESAVVEVKPQYGYSEDSYITTQQGKDWYNEQVVKITDNIVMQMHLADLANYRFPIAKRTD